MFAGMDERQVSHVWGKQAPNGDSGILAHIKEHPSFLQRFCFDGCLTYLTMCDHLVGDSMGNCFYKYLVETSYWLIGLDLSYFDIY